MPYESSRKMSGAAVRRDGRYLHVIKGSPEVIGEYVAMEPEEKARIMRDIEERAAEGYRIIAVAKAESHEPSIEKMLERRVFEWVGYAAILDPLREGVADAVKRCQRAGIAVVMVTGDHPSTAYHIARELEIAMSPEEVMDGESLTRWSENGEDPEEIAAIRVFARVAPAQKLQIVKAFQRLGHYVAVTGDGVNDAPALKRADVGIAMGLRGTDVAKGAADMILLDDNFASIVGAVREGRRQYDNIKKFVTYLLSSNTGEVVAIFVNILLGGPLILLPVQILWMNLVTDGLTAVALGLEPAEKGIMERPPRSVNAPFLELRGILMILLLGGYIGGGALWLFHHYLTMGLPEGEAVALAQTVAFTGIIVLEKMNVFNYRSLHAPMPVIGFFSNPWVVGAWLLTVGAQAAAVYVPFLQDALHTVPLGWEDWLLIFEVAVPIFVVVELYKAFEWWVMKRRG